MVLTARICYGCIHLCEVKMARSDLDLVTKQLPADLQAVHDFIDSGVPANTLKSYRGAVSRFSKWLGDHPLNDATLASYLTWLFAQGHAKA